MFEYIYEQTENKLACDDEGNDALFIATQHDNLNFVTYLLTKGYNAKKLRKGNVSLLHIAVSNNNIAMIDLFIKDSDMEMRSVDLGSPMDWAIAYGQLNAAKYLLTKGAKITTENPSSNVPPGIHLAINTNNNELAHFLLESEEKCYHVKDS